MLDDFKTELQRLGGSTNLEHVTGSPSSPPRPPSIAEKSQDSHIEVADAPHSQGRAETSSSSHTS